MSTPGDESDEEEDSISKVLEEDDEKIVHELLHIFENQNNSFLEYVENQCEGIGYNRNSLHWICRYAPNTKMIMQVFEKFPQMIEELDDEGFLPTSILAESNLMLAVEFARELLENSKVHLKHLQYCLSGIDLLGHRNKVSLDEEMNENYGDFLDFLQSDKNNEIMEFLINRIRREDKHFINFLIKYNYLKEVVYDRLYEILPKLLEATDTSCAAWFLKKECTNLDTKCEYINKVMKELDYDDFSPKEEKKNFCDKEKDLLIWCCFSGRHRLVKIFLRKSQFDVISLGVFCSHVIQKISEEPCLSIESVNLMKKTFMICQQTAKDALEATFLQCIDKKDKDIISDYLELKNPSFKNVSLFDMAIKARCSQVIAVTPSKEIISNRWYGVIEPICVHGLFGWAPRFCVALFSFEWLLPMNVLCWWICRCWLIKIESTNKHCKDFFPDLYKFAIDICRTPYVKCTKYVILHIVFLIVLTNVLLSSLHTTPSRSEIVSFIYVLAYGMEEVKQLVHETRTKGYKFYFKNKWNYYDLIALFTFILGFIRRLFLPNEKSFTRICYVLSMLFFSVRLLFVCTLFENMGSKLKIIRTIVSKDVVPFLLILFLLIIPFGVAAQSMFLVDGYGNSSTNNAANLFFNGVSYGFFAMAGEFQLDKLEEDKSVNLVAMYSFLMVYVLCTNIVLLNLLIALFSKTAEAIDEDEIHRSVTMLDRMFIVEEFESKSVFTPPFNIVQILFTIGHCLLKRWNKKYRNTENSIQNACRNEKESNNTQNICEWNFKILQAAALHFKRNKVGNLQNNPTNSTKTFFKNRHVKLLDEFDEKLEKKRTILNTDLDIKLNGLYEQLEKKLESALFKKM